MARTNRRIKGAKFVKLKDFIEFKTKELLQTYKQVQYLHNEMIKMNSNSDKSDYLSKEASLDIEVQEIKNRFKELDKNNYIDAVKVTFEVKPPKKRLFIEKEVYCKII